MSNPSAKAGRYKRWSLAQILVRKLRCCTPKQFASWVELAPLSYDSAGGLFRTFCEDCRVSYRREMEGEGNCLRLDMDALSYLADEAADSLLAPLATVPA